MRATFRIDMSRNYTSRRLHRHVRHVPLLPRLRRPRSPRAAEGGRSGSPGVRVGAGSSSISIPKWPSGTIIADADDRIVLVRRAIEPGYGKWVFPGGYVDRGEQLAEAALREAREECGLEVRLDGLVDIYSYAGRTPIIIVYAAALVGGTLAVDDEGLEARWFAADEMCRGTTWRSAARTRPFATISTAVATRSAPSRHREISHRDTRDTEGGRHRGRDHRGLSVEAKKESLCPLCLCGDLQLCDPCGSVAHSLWLVRQPLGLALRGGHDAVRPADFRLAVQRRVGDRHVTADGIGGAADVQLPHQEGKALLQ